MYSFVHANGCEGFKHVCDCYEHVLSTGTIVFRKASRWVYVGLILMIIP